MKPATSTIESEIDDDQEQTEPTYVDIPSREGIGDPNYSFVNVAIFDDPTEALKFVRDNFGADEQGRICLLSPEPTANDAADTPVNYPAQQQAREWHAMEDARKADPDFQDDDTCPHTNVRSYTEDGERYHACSDCGTVKTVAEWQADTPVAEWSGSPDPADPDNYWIDDKTGERVSAATGERTPVAEHSPLVNLAARLAIAEGDREELIAALVKLTAASVAALTTVGMIRGRDLLQKATDNARAVLERVEKEASRG